MSKAPIQDWELTAYALNELGGRERASVEARLMDEPELRDEFYALQEVGSLLEEGFEQEAQPFLRVEQREQILRGESRGRRTQLLQATLVASALGLAACLALGFVKFEIGLPGSSGERVAQVSQYLTKSLNATGAAQPSPIDPRALQISGDEVFLQRVLTLDLGVGTHGVGAPVLPENARFSPPGMTPQSF